MYSASVVGVDPLEHAGQRAFVVRDGDEVDVIRHQAVGKDRDSVVDREFTQEVEVEQAVLVAVKDLLSIVSALRDMMRESGCTGSCVSR